MNILNKIKKRSFRKTFKLLKFHFLINLEYKSRYFIARIRGIFKKQKIFLFYPVKLSDQFVIWKIINNLGYKITNNPYKNHDFSFFWDPWEMDELKEKEYPLLKRMSKKEKIYNFKCKDLSKENVGRSFRKVFGYDLSVDPSKFFGKCVEKSNRNACKDGKIIDCPRKKKPGFSYQEFVDTVNKNKMLVDLRVPIIRREIPFVYVRFKNRGERFIDSKKPKVRLVNVKEIFSEKEVKQILDFCEDFQLDYGELDILRDKDTKKIYIVDANTTPFGPHKLLRAITQEAIEKLSKSFARNFT
jgi:hypothetical protein